MNRLLIPAALAAFLVGCARPAIFGEQANQTAEADYAPVEIASEPTVVVREIQREVPVVYVDTVYMAADPEPVQPVYVQNEYNEYNEYNHTDVYVHQRVIVPPSPPRRQPGWSPREPERRPADRRRDGGRDRPREPEKPKTPGPVHPVKRTLAPVPNVRKELPAPPTPPVQPAPPQGQALGRSVPAAQIQNGATKQVSAKKVDRTETTAPGEVQVQAVTQARRK